MNFTTRPELQGTFGAVASTHWLASSAGMKMLEMGGNAFDAAAAAGFVLQVVEPHLNGPGGDMTLQFFDADKEKNVVLCGQGYAPAGATIQHFKENNISIIPGDGLLATVVPGAMGAWFKLCRDYGKLKLADVLEPAMLYARDGFPLLPRVAQTINNMEPFFKEEWPTSYRQWNQGDNPVAGRRFKLIRLAETYREIIQYAETSKNRDLQFDLAYEAFYNGFIAERIENFINEYAVKDGSGQINSGVLTAQDLANWEPSFELPVQYNYHDWTISKAGPWSQGPVLLQSLALLTDTDFSQIDHESAEFVHALVEAMKLSYADREVYYGDPEFFTVPLSTLLSDEYNLERRKLLSSTASKEFQPGFIDHYEAQLTATEKLIDGFGITDETIYEPTMSHLSERRGDTVHIDVVDQWGNMVSATPSGGWLQSSPTIPELGFCLNTRAQMFALQPNLPNSLEPFKRPRTTLTPTLAYNRKDGRRVAMGTPGGDQQDQWQLAFFLRLAHYNLNIQEAIDAPLFHTNHFPSSFHPRKRQPNQTMIEGNFDKQVLKDLELKGHIIERSQDWSIGRLTAIMREENGLVRAGATPRGMQAYAIGR